MSMVLKWGHRKDSKSLFVFIHLVLCSGKTHGLNWGLLCFFQSSYKRQASCNLLMTCKEQENNRMLDHSTTISITSFIKWNSTAFALKPFLVVCGIQMFFFGLSQKLLELAKWQGHHHNGDQAAWRPHILCSICIHSFGVLAKAVR